MNSHHNEIVILSESAVADESKDLHLPFAPSIQHGEGAPGPSPLRTGDSFASK
jgi:hypothetical protein